MEVMEVFATRIRELRFEQGLGVRELAAKIGLSHAAISLYENQKRTPDIMICKKFADFFGVTGDYLIGLSNEGR